MAASVRAAGPPVTTPDTEMLARPLVFAKMPWRSLDTTFPDISMSIVAEPAALALMPDLLAVMDAPLATATLILCPEFNANIPLPPPDTVTASRTVIETSGADTEIPCPLEFPPVVRIGPEATTVTDPELVTVASMPSVTPVIVAALIVRLPFAECVRMPMPVVAATAPVAVTETSPKPLACIPWEEPVTEPAAIVTSFERA